MFKCKDCGRQFGTLQALRGHSGHCPKKKRESKDLMPQPQENPEAVAEVASPDVPVEEVCSNVAADVEGAIAEAPADTEEANPNESDIGRLERIRNLLAQGYTVKELIAPPFEFPESSVYEQVPKVFPPKEKPKDEESEDEDDSDRMPAVYRKDQVINPETLLRRYLLNGGSHDDELRFQGMMELRASILLAMELATVQERMASAEAKRIEPLLKVLREGREELDSAAARAKDSSAQIAHDAAFEVAQGMGGAFSAEIRDLKAALPGKPEEMDPIKKMFVDAMQPHAAQAIGQLFASLFKPSPQGGAQPQGGQQSAGMQGQPAQPAVPGEPPRHMPPGEEDQWTEI
jgi:hypothetical protein